MRIINLLVAFLISSLCAWSQSVTIDKITYSLYDRDGVTEARRAPMHRAPEVASTIEIAPFSIAPGEEKEIDVLLNNPGDAFTSFQFDIKLPEGISVVSDEDGYFISVGSRTTSRKHTIEADGLSNGGVRVLCYSGKNDTFSGEEGAVAVITVKASEEITEGEYQFKMTNIVLSRPDVSEFVPENFTGTITVEKGFVLGDVNGDGKVNINDYIGVANHILGNSPAGFNEAAADTNGDGKININDYIGVANIILTGSPSGK